MWREMAIAGSICSIQRTSAYAAGFNGPVISPFDRLSVSDNPAIRELNHKNLIGSIVLDLGSHKITYVGQYNKTNNVNYGGGNIGHILPNPHERTEPEKPGWQDHAHHA